jgi:hypothetical protein
MLLNHKSAARHSLKVAPDAAVENMVRENWPDQGRFFHVGKTKHSSAMIGDGAWTYL